MYIINARFEWDLDKARRNAIKHGVGFKEAATAFHDPEGMIAEDAGHSHYERRCRLIGESSKGRVLVVVFTLRPGSAIRIISAREAGPQERIRYDETKGIPV